MEGGRWCLRIVSSSPELPKMEGEATNEEIMTTFYSKEVVDYCLPDRDGCILRYVTFLPSYVIYQSTYELMSTSLQIFFEGNTRLSSQCPVVYL